MKIDFTQDEISLVVMALQCAAAESWTHGHEEQAEWFRAIVRKIEGENADED